MEIKETMVLTGLSALSYLGYSDFNPAKVQVAMARGTNTSAYNDEYKVFTMSKDLLNYKVKETDDFKYFSLERIFVELSRFDMENTIKGEVIKKLEKNIIPDEVKKIYDFIKSKTRGINFDHVIEFLNKNHFDVIEKILDNKLMANEYIKDFFLATLGDNDIPVLLKGGSAVELFIDHKRSTKDIDLHSGEKGIERALKLMTNKKSPLYVEITEDDLSKIKNKGIPKLNLKLRSPSTRLNKFLQGDKDRLPITLPITFNKSMSDEEITNIIDMYKLSKRPLKYLDGKSVTLFSEEMLVAEKYHSIIIKPTNTKRSKDLFDLNQIYKDDLDWNALEKWLFRRFANNKKMPLDKQEAIKWIKEHKDIPLVKIKENWNKAQGMYTEKTLDYDQAIKVYLQISEKVLLNK